MGSFICRGRDFILDGKPFVVRSGAIHYFRVPAAEWRDRLLKLKECGFNTVETYIAWNVHEKVKGEFRAEGNSDYGKFLDIAKSLGLYAIVRPGPYICAEWEGGGFPSWLYADKNIRLRCCDETYLFYVKRYLKNVFDGLRSRLISRGGNVIMLQIENEYGSYGCDKKYLRELTDFYRTNLPDCLYFVSDGPEAYMMEGGKQEGVLQFLNFGSKVEKNMTILKDARPDNPLFCSEFWCGWFDTWHGIHHTRDAEEVCREVEAFLKNGYSFNFYMFCGGTNFGFMNGAELNEGVYEAVTTSYDYNALLTEAGDRTPAYYAVRELFIRYGADVPSVTAEDSRKIAYGQVKFTGSALLKDNLRKIGTEKTSALPLSMEEMGDGYGYILYSAVLEKGFEDFPLEIKGLADRALIFVDGEKLGIYERGRPFDRVSVNTVEREKTIDILVENMGRIGFGTEFFERKGIEGVRVFFPLVMNWKNISLPMEDLTGLDWQEAKISSKPCFYKGEFNAEDCADSFLETTGFSKGFVTVNGFNIGRYYTAAGPQKRLYVPASLLKKGRNEVVIFDSDGSSSLTAEFFETPEYS